MEPIVLYPDASVVIAQHSMKALLDILDYGMSPEFAPGVPEQLTPNEMKEVLNWLPTGATTSVSDAILVPPTWGRA